jgi:hypothetical protein
MNASVPAVISLTHAVQLQVFRAALVPVVVCGSSGLPGRLTSKSFTELRRGCVASFLSDIWVYLYNLPVSFALPPTADRSLDSGTAF